MMAGDCIENSEGTRIQVFESAVDRQRRQTRQSRCWSDRLATGFVPFEPRAAVAWFFLVSAIHTGMV